MSSERLEFPKDELTIQQKIFAEFISIDEIEKAIEFADSRGLSDDEREQAIVLY